jgi:hypothetical protein
MAKILGSIYLIVLVLFTVWFIVFYISEWIDEMKVKRMRRRVTVPENPVEPVIDVVGKSTTSFLAPLITRMESMMSMDLELEQQPAVETEPDISPSDVEISLSFPLDEDEQEMYRNDNMDASDDLSQGLTFEQINHALDGVEGRKSGENDEYLAGETFAIMPTDFLSMICMQTDHEAMVKKLIAGYLDYPGKIKPVPAPVANFDINIYV